MAKASPAQRRGGRPTQVEAAALHQRLREAAVRIFLENGYDATTMVAIADAAGIAKPTLYARYPDKRAVFLDVIPWAFSRAVPVDADDTVDKKDLRAALIAIGQGALRHALDPDIVQLHRIARTEAHRFFPEFALSADSLGWARRQQQVMDLLRQHVAAGAIDVDDIELAAEHFLAMVEVLPARLADFGLYRSRTEERRRLLHAVDLFLRGILPR